MFKKRNIKIPYLISKSPLPDSPFRSEAAQNSDVVIRKHGASDFYHVAYSVQLRSTDSTAFEPRCISMNCSWNYKK